jgi:hypothetical protein
MSAIEIPIYGSSPIEETSSDPYQASLKALPIDYDL